MSSTADQKNIPLEPPDREPPNVTVPQPERVTGWALVGLGKLAIEEILPAIKIANKCKLVALVSDHDEKAESIAEKFRIRLDRIYDYTNFDTIRDADDVDIVYITLPNNQHWDFTVRALNAGKHVLCEKPMAEDAAQCKEMIKAANRNKKMLMIAYRLHFEPFHKKAMEIMRSGELGKLRIFEATHCLNIEAPNIRLAKKTGNTGPLEDVGIYCLNAARYISGEEPTEVSAIAVKPEGDERFREVPGHITFQMKFPSGALAICACGFDSAKADNFKAICEKGYLSMEPAFAYHSLKLSSFHKEDHTKKEYPLRPENHFTLEMDHFAECVIENRYPRTSGKEGLRDVKIIEKLRESMRMGGAMVKLVFNDK